jgi:hypothetical protein
MVDTNNAEPLPGYTTRTIDNAHPHYFTSFENYCCGPKAKRITSPSNKDFLPIPESIKQTAEQIVAQQSELVQAHLTQMIQYTSSIPQLFLRNTETLDYQKYFLDRLMFKVMTDAHVINWMPSLKKTYPVRTSGKRDAIQNDRLINSKAMETVFFMRF